MNKSGKVHQITLTAILAAIIVLLAFTPLGYLRIGLVSITFLTEIGRASCRERVLAGV